MLEYRVVMLDLPTTVRGYVLRTFDGFCTIVLNSKLNIWQNRKSFKHELDHLLNGDFDSDLTATEIEAMRRKK